MPTHDVSSLSQEELRQYVERLEASDRRKNEFLGRLAHEIGNLFVPVQLGLQLMQQPGADQSTLSQVRAILEEQVPSMMQLIEDLRKISRVARGKVELHWKSVDAQAAIGEAVKAIQPEIEKKELELTVSYPDQPIVIEADREQLEQVAMHLLDNAVRYTESGGHVWLTVSQEDGELILKVRDTGIGISSELLPEIFEPFAQQDPHQSGWGIGLTLARDLTELHGGRITASSPGFGKGAEFIVRFPISRATGSANE